MKKPGVILFGIVFILGLSIVTAPAQQVEKVNPDGVASSGLWSPAPSVERLNDWDGDPDADFASNIYDDSYLSGGLTVDLEDPTGGPYTAIKVWLRTRSFGDTDVVVRLKGVQDLEDLGGEWKPEMLAGGFTEYSSDVQEWTGLNMSAAALADLQVEIEIYAMDMLDISAIQVELVSEDTDPIPEVTGAIHVEIDYLPHKSSNPLNYRSRGKVRVVIFGSADFDVRQIDRKSVRLAGVAPVRDHIRRVYRHAYRARDEYGDLVLMFKTQHLIKALEESSVEELENGDPVDLILTGNLQDGGATPIEGKDTADVYGKRHKHKKKVNWKNHWKWWR